ncbi:MAG: NUDIX domain-containing protein [Ignavibacteriae bacterium]|nr:NUDIX domain-containing protein [Ignavibacteriota bacterium]
MKFATLLYIKNTIGDYLLLERVKEPNKGFLSPPGGKLDIDKAESPVACAVRECFEECGIKSRTSDWKLIGIVTEKSYPDIGDIMIFCFEYLKSIDTLPDASNEGLFRFVSPSEIRSANIPDTDKLFIWNFVLKNKSTLFSIHIDCESTPYKCIVEQE